MPPDVSHNDHQKTKTQESNLVENSSPLSLPVGDQRLHHLPSCVYQRYIPKSLSSQLTVSLSQLASLLL